MVMVTLPNTAHMIHSQHSEKDWLQISICIVHRFGGVLHPAPNGFRVQFPYEDNPSLSLFQNGFWYDFRGGAVKGRGGTRELRDHLIYRGFREIPGAGDMPDEDFERMFRQMDRRKKTRLSPAFVADIWSRMLWGAPPKPHDRTSAQAWTRKHQESIDQKESTTEYFTSRGLKTDWCHPDIIRTRPLVDSASKLEKEMSEAGADFAACLPYYDISAFFSPEKDLTKIPTKTGMQRIFLQHGDGNYLPACKISRAMAGSAGVTPIVLPPAKTSPIQPDTMMRLLSQLDNVDKPVFNHFCEGLETGLSPAQFMGGKLFVLWSRSGFSNLADFFMQAENLPAQKPNEIDLIWVDRDISRDGEVAAAKLAFACAATGRRMLYLLPPLPPDTPDWTGDWNDVLVEGRMDDALAHAIKNSKTNLDQAPIKKKEEPSITLPSGEQKPIIVPIKREVRRILGDIQVQRLIMRSQGVNTSLVNSIEEFSTGMGKSSMLTEIQGRADRKTLLHTPQRRDADQLYRGAKRKNNDYYPRHSRTDIMADDDDMRSMILSRLHAQPVFWLDDGDYRGDSRAIKADLQKNTLPSCYRTHARADNQAETIEGTLIKNGETHAELLSQKNHGCGEECAICPHGQVAHILIQAERAKTPEEAQEFLDDLENSVHRLAPYHPINGGKASENATLGQFLPCAMQINRMRSYTEEVVVSTSSMADVDVRMLNSAKQIYADENFETMLSMHVTVNHVRESIVGLQYWIDQTKGDLKQKRQNPESERDPEVENKLLDKIKFFQQILKFYKFLNDHYLDPIQCPDKDATLAQFPALFHSKEVQETIVKPYLKAMKKLNINHIAPWERYRPANHAAYTRAKTVPTAFAKNLLLAIHDDNLFFEKNNYNDLVIDAIYPTAMTQKWLKNRDQEGKYGMHLYSATAALELVMTARSYCKIHAEDHVHATWHAHAHSKTAWKRNPEKALEKAKAEIRKKWNQNLMVAFLTFKAMAQKLIEWAEKEYPDKAYLIGWMGRDHIAHNRWSGIDGLVIWSLDMAPLQTLAKRYIAIKNTFKFHKLAPLNIQEIDLWENVSWDYVDFPHLGCKVLSRLHENHDFWLFVRYRITQDIVQAVGRLRGVNHQGRPQFVDIYSDIAPIDGLFGFYVDDVRAQDTVTPDYTHQQAVSRVAKWSCHRLTQNLQRLRDDPQMDIAPGNQKKIYMGEREIQAAMKAQGQAGFSHRVFIEAMDLVVHSRPDILDYHRQPGKKSYFVVRQDQRPACASKNANERVSDILSALFRPGIDTQSTTMLRFPFSTLREITQGQCPDADQITIASLLTALQVQNPDLDLTLTLEDTDILLTVDIAVPDDEPEDADTTQLTETSAIPTVDTPYIYHHAGDHSTQSDSPAACKAAAGKAAACRSAESCPRFADNIQMAVRRAICNPAQNVAETERASLLEAAPPDASLAVGNSVDSYSLAVCSSLPDTALPTLIHGRNASLRFMALPPEQMPADRLTTLVLAEDADESWDLQATAFAGHEPAPGKLPEDTDPHRVFLPYLCTDWLDRKIRAQVTWERAEYRAGRAAVYDEAVDHLLNQQIGLEIRKEWARAVSLHNQDVTDNLQKLTYAVDNALFQHPEYTDIRQALCDAETELAPDLDENPLLRGLLAEWRQSPGLPRFHLQQSIVVNIWRVPRHPAEKCETT